MFVLVQALVGTENLWPSLSEIEVAADEILYDLCERRLAHPAAVTPALAGRPKKLVRPNIKGRSLGADIALITNKPHHIGRVAVKEAVPGRPQKTDQGDRHWLPL